MVRERTQWCTVCDEPRRFDPSKGDPGCPCGHDQRPDNQLRVTGHFKTPILMYSVGMSMDEIPAFQRACPGVDHEGGVPIARSRHQKKLILRHFNYQETK